MQRLPRMAWSPVYGRVGVVRLPLTLHGTIGTHLVTGVLSGPSSSRSSVHRWSAWHFHRLLARSVLQGLP